MGKWDLFNHNTTHLPPYFDVDGERMISFLRRQQLKRNILLRFQFVRHHNKFVVASEDDIWKGPILGAREGFLNK